MENKITFKVIARKLKRFGDTANLYELSEKIEYEKYISKDIQMIKKTRYVIVWAAGCVEEFYYFVLPANKFGKPHYHPIYFRKSPIYYGFDEIMSECIDSIMKGVSNG